MGTDIYSETGVIQTLDSMLQSIPRRGIPLHLWAVNRYIRLRVATDHQADFNCLTTLERSTQRQFITALAQVSRYDPDSELEYDPSGYILAIWKVLLKSMYPELPKLREIQVFTSPRECGWDVPLNTPCFIFDSKTLFRTTLSNKGKKMRRIFGQCQETTWTIMSY